MESRAECAALLRERLQCAFRTRPAAVEPSGTTTARTDKKPPQRTNVPRIAKWIAAGVAAFLFMGIG
jgi:hypothetical protein